MGVFRKPLFWVASSRDDLKSLPEEVQDLLGHALDIAQQGMKHADDKPLRGFAGAGVLEVIEDAMGDTFRAVYTVRFSYAVYVLHVFKKKSKQGVKTPIQDRNLVNHRLQAAREHYSQWLRKGK